MMFDELLHVRILVSEIKRLSPEQRAELDRQLYPIMKLADMYEELRNPEPTARDAWVPDPLEPLVMNPVQPRGFRGLGGLLEQYGVIDRIRQTPTPWTVWPAPDPATRGTWCGQCRNWTCPVIHRIYLTRMIPPIPVE